MNISELFCGVAVAIDDEINKEDANIRRIISQLEQKNVPLIKYDSIPNIESIDHFQNISFLLLDWRLIKSNITDDDISNGIKVPSGLESYDAKININFIKELCAKCFCPIFIFTNEDTNTIKADLTKAKLYNNNRPNTIFVKSKSDVMEENGLFLAVEEWLKNTPSVYVLKEWEKEYQKSKNMLFTEMQSISSLWPCLLWQNYKADGAIQSLELGELITRNLHTRMAPFNFSTEILDIDTSIVSKSEIREVLEGEQFIKASNLHSNNIGTGDIFVKKEHGKKYYYLNIRAQCDLVRVSEIDNIQLYCLRGKKITDGCAQKIYEKGQFIERVFQAFVPFVDGGKIIEFSFQELYQPSWGEMKTLRIGRLLSPYIHRIQQRYSLYMQRQGTSRIPLGAFDFPSLSIPTESETKEKAT